MILETEAFLNRELRLARRARAVSSDTISAAEVQAARDLPEPLFVVFVSPWSDELRELLVTSAGLVSPPRDGAAGELKMSLPTKELPASRLPEAEVETPPWLDFAGTSYAQVS
jgi:hypothetical protein